MIQELRELTSSIIESMFYLTEETQPLKENSNYKYAVSIKDTKVEIILMFCEKTAKVMAENFLGTDDINENDIIDTLKEAINIITGNFVRVNMNDKSMKINIPFTINTQTPIAFENYQFAFLFYKEETLKILLKME